MNIDWAFLVLVMQAQVQHCSPRLSSIADGDSQPVQQVVEVFLPARWSAAIEAQSRQWVMCCTCGHEISMWDAGGIRYKAVGKPRRWARCPRCGFTWHRIEKRTT